MICGGSGSHSRCTCHPHTELRCERLSSCDPPRPPGAEYSSAPRLGVPLPGGVLDGVDALLSTVQMPAGIPVATFAVGSAGARNAAIFAAQIVAGDRPEVRASLEALRSEGEEKVLAGDRQITDAVSGEETR